MGSRQTRYDEDFKKSLVSLYHEGKVQSSLCRENGVSQTALSRWIKAYSPVTIEDREVMTAIQIKELQKRMGLTCPKHRVLLLDYSANLP